MQIRSLLVLAVLLAGASVGWAEPTPTDPRLEGIDSLLENVLDDYHDAGFSMAVVHKDSVVYAKAFGYRDDNKKLHATPNTLYALLSSSRAFPPALLGTC